jgi:DNA-binding response OmpR family regulator
MSQGAKRVLLVDDSELLRMTLGAFLEEAGYLVSEAGTVAEARASLDAGPYHAVLLDMMLPDGFGTELIPLVRAQLPEAKVVLLTGLDRVDAAGADLVLIKGGHPDEIVRELDAL